MRRIEIRDQRTRSWNEIRWERIKIVMILKNLQWRRVEGIKGHGAEMRSLYIQSLAWGLSDGADPFQQGLDDADEEKTYNSELWWFVHIWPQWWSWEADYMAHCWGLFNSEGWMILNEENYKDEVIDGWLKGQWWILNTSLLKDCDTFSAKLSKLHIWMTHQ